MFAWVPFVAEFSVYGNEALAVTQVNVTTRPGCGVCELFSIAPLCQTRGHQGVSASSGF